MTKQKSIKIFSGVGKRFLAFIIDLAILNLTFGLVYLILMFINYTYIDFIIVFIIIFLLYFTIGDSILCNGQTVGKKLLKLQVVKLDGSNIGIGIALGRAFYVSVLYFHFYYYASLTNYLHDYLPKLAIILITTFVIAFVLFSTTVFCAFNHYRQAIQDVLFKSLVVVKGKYKQEYLESYFNIKRVIAGYLITSGLTVLSVIIALTIALIWG